MYTKKFFGSALSITSASFYLASLTSSIFLIYYLHQKYVNKIQGTAINDWLTLTGVGAALSFTLAIALMVGVNAIITQEKKKQITDDDNSYDHQTRSVANDCFSNLLLWWCCCGPDINICSNNNRSSDNSQSDGFCVIILATLAVCGCMIGYLVYAFNTARRLCNMKNPEVTPRYQHPGRENLYSQTSPVGHDGNLHQQLHNSSSPTAYGRGGCPSQATTDLQPTAPPPSYSELYSCSPQRLSGVSAGKN